jgi:hypothetical protein
MVVDVWPAGLPRFLNPVCTKKCICWAHKIASLTDMGVVVTACLEIIAPGWGGVQSLLFLAFYYLPTTRHCWRGAVCTFVPISFSMLICDLSLLERSSLQLSSDTVLSLVCVTVFYPHFFFRHALEEMIMLREESRQKVAHTHQ